SLQIQTARLEQARKQEQEAVRQSQVQNNRSRKEIARLNKELAAAHKQARAVLRQKLNPPIALALNFPADVGAFRIPKEVERGDNTDTTETFPLLRSPVATAVETDTPTFEWLPYPGAQQYLLFVEDTT